MKTLTAAGVASQSASEIPAGVVLITGGLCLRCNQESSFRQEFNRAEVRSEQSRPLNRYQFSNSPDLNKALLDAIIGALDAHQLMSTQALNSEDVREGMIDILLNHTNLYEDLRDQGLKE